MTDDPFLAPNERFPRGPDGRSTDLPSGAGVPFTVASQAIDCTVPEGIGPTSQCATIAPSGWWRRSIETPLPAAAPP